MTGLLKTPAPISRQRGVVDAYLDLLELMPLAPDIEQHLDELEPALRRARHEGAARASAREVQIHVQDHGPEALQRALGDELRDVHRPRELRDVRRRGRDHERLCVEHLQCFGCDLAVEEEERRRA